MVLKLNPNLGGRRALYTNSPLFAAATQVLFGSNRLNRSLDMRMNSGRLSE